MLVALFSAQQANLDQLLSTSLLTIPDGTPKSAGIGIGEAAAATMLAARTNDCRFGPFVVPVGDDPGTWRPTPPAFVVDPGAADIGWTPLLVNPPFPDHPSGHGCVTGAIVNTAQNFFGTDKIGFSTFSNHSMTTRSFDRLSHLIREVIDARGGPVSTSTPRTCRVP